VRFLEKYCLKRLDRVEAIITISEYSKKEIVSLTGVNPERIFVTPLGVDRSFSPEGNRMRGLPDPYILYVGNLEPRKNLPMLLTAFQSLPRRLKERYSLVIAGAEGWHANGLRKALRPLQKGGKVILTGYVPQSRLSDLYRGASLFAYPSYYEGFGLPVLEAMACGVPVISSDSSSLPEVVGDAGILVDPFLAGEWSETMARVLSDENLQKEIGQRGLNQARMFTWERCAGETIRIYQRVLGERR
jgi:alpha-1,3-rhamnosyl/mannosyltransferase